MKVTYPCTNEFKVYRPLYKQEYPVQIIGYILQTPVQK